MTQTRSIAAGLICFLVSLTAAGPGALAESNFSTPIGRSLTEMQAGLGQSNQNVPVDIGKMEASAKAGESQLRNLGAYSKALDALPSGAGPRLRGAREVAIYAQVSPSVVLILNGDTLGSGTLLDSSGLIVTNWHVIARATSVGIIFKPAAEGTALSRSQIVQGKVIRIDQVSDLALVQVPFVPTQAHPARIAAATGLQVGDDVHAIGHPTGEAWTYTRGIVSQIRRDYKWNTEEHLQHHADVVQTQTPINPGNSGGPLLNNDGDMVGVNSFKGEGEGLNFAVSASAVTELLNAHADRMAMAVPSTEKANVKAKCGPKQMKSWRMTDPPGVATSFDLNCTGVVDMVVELPDDPKAPGVVLLDTRHTGKADTVIYSKDRVHPDYAYYDTTGSGKPDLVGYYHNHEDEPYRVEKYSAAN
jgi:S1-C subfamily serine protease